MVSIPVLRVARLVPGALTALVLGSSSCALAQSTPAANVTAPANTTALANTTTTAATTPTKGGRGKAAKPKKPPKDAVFDEASAIVAGKEACGEVGETYAKEHWRAQDQHGVWRVWVTPIHCDGGGTCPTFEVHVTASDGVPSACTQRIALY